MHSSSLLLPSPWPAALFLIAIFIRSRFTSSLLSPLLAQKQNSLSNNRTKEEKPTLAGVNIKTRKRNIAVALDPGAFADAVAGIFEVKSMERD